MASTRRRAVVMPLPPPPPPPSPPRRRRSRRKPLAAVDHATRGGGKAHTSREIGIAAAGRQHAGLDASPRLWALLREAQEEMERGTDLLGDELNKLWRGVHGVAGGGVEEAGIPNGERTGAGAAGGETAAAGRRRRGSRRRDRVAGDGCSAPLPQGEADALLGGLGQLQAEMEAEARSFQRHKVEIVRKLESLGRRWDGREDEEIVELEDEAESMRAAVVASRARLLDRVRELQRLSRGGVHASAAATASASAATTASYNARVVAPARRMSGRGSDPATPAGSSRSLEDLVHSAQAVVAAREELAHLHDAVEATRGELAREHERARAAREQTSRLEALRASAAAVADRSNQDAGRARVEAEAATRALQTARDGLAAAQAAQRTAEEAAESESFRLEGLRRQTVGLENELRTVARTTQEREARAEAAAAAAKQEEARLEDCRDSFGLEVEGLQKGVGELESEAVGWKEALEQARATLATEQERGRADKLRLEAEKARLGEAVEGLKAEARTWGARLDDSRRRHECDSEMLAREARKAAVELQGLRSKVAEVRSKLQAGQAELQAVAAAIEEKSVGVDAAEADAASLERRAAELSARIEDLEAERDRASCEGQTARRRQAEELSRWKEAMVERRKEFDGLSELVRSKAAALGDVESQVKAGVAQTRQARGEQEAAEARAAGALRGAREAASLAERGMEKAEREESRAAAAEARTADAVEQLRKVAAEVNSESSSLDSFRADLHAARQAATEAQEESTRLHQQLAVLAEKRREEESAIAAARQRAAAFAREEAGLRATAMAARREGGEGKEAATTARTELAELREAADKERRALEGYRDGAMALEAEVARKKEEDRFAREAADAQQSRLDGIKREVTLLRDERLRVEKSVWSLKSELEALSTRRDDAARRDRRREREEGALAARREALAAAAASEEERLGLAKTAKELLEAEVAELGARAGALAADVSSATREAAALREDASAAASRADEARRRTSTLENETAQLSSQAEILRSTRGALNSELSGLRHELGVLRERMKVSCWKGNSRRNCAPEPPVVVVAGTRVGEGGLSYATSLNREAMGRADEDGGVSRSEGAERHAWGGVNDHGLGKGGYGVGNTNGEGGRGGAGNLVEIVADFQGRLRRQVQAALAEGGGRSTEPVPFRLGGAGPVEPVRPRGAGDARGGLLRAGQRSRSVSCRGGGGGDVLGDLEKRVGSV